LHVETFRKSKYVTKEMKYHGSMQHDVESNVVLDAGGRDVPQSGADCEPDEEEDGS